MNRSKRTLRDSIRIIWAIALKDMGDAIQNKTIQGLVVGILMVMLTGRALPLLLGLSDAQTIVVLDEESSELVPALQKSRGVRLVRVTSWEAMEEALTMSGDVSLGVVLPAGLDERIDAGQPPRLEGYLAHWASEDDGAELQAFFEKEFAALAGEPLKIDISAARVYPAPDSDRFPGMAAGVIALVTITVGLFLVPYLLIEEKQSKTIDALLVSPASIREVVIGKTVAGTFYCLAATGVALALNHGLVVNWGVTLLATACGVLFAVACGLLLGSLFEQAPQMQAAGAAVMAVLALPMFLVDFSANWPPLIRAVLSWLPSVTLADTLRISFSNVVPAGQVLSNLAVTSACGVAVLAVVAWKVRRSDR